MSVVMCVLSGRGLCDGLITRSEESYRLWRVFVCYLGTSGMRLLKLVKGCKCRIEEEEEELYSSEIMTDLKHSEGQMCNRSLYQI